MRNGFSLSTLASRFYASSLFGGGTVCVLFVLLPAAAAQRSKPASLLLPVAHILPNFMPKSEWVEEENEGGALTGRDRQQKKPFQFRVFLRSN